MSDWEEHLAGAPVSRKILWQKLQIISDSACPSCEMDALQRHLQTCRTCRHEWETLCALRKAVGRSYSEEKAPDSLRTRVSVRMTQIRISRRY